MARAGDQLENPLTGERITFLLTAAENGGELLELDDFWTRPGHRAAEHIHPQMQERWEILSGLAAFQIGGRERTAGPGETVIAPQGVPHLAWNAGEGVVHLRIQMRPALRWEQFIEALFGLARDAHARGEVPEQSALMDLLGGFPAEIALP
jgi:quercetin dioxygenase-like cupin family protein